MENATHTSGPFAISRNATPDYAPQYSIYAESGNGNDIAIVKGDNAERDAALFAASPDMLAALENALPWLVKADIDGAFKNCALPLGGRKAWEQIERAIAKAKGQV